MNFTEQLFTRKDLLPYQTEIEKFIEKSGCTNITFEELSPMWWNINTRRMYNIHNNTTISKRNTTLHTLS